MINPVSRLHFSLSNSFRVKLASMYATISCLIKSVLSRKISTAVLRSISSSLFLVGIGYVTVYPSPDSFSRISKIISNLVLISFLAAGVTILANVIVLAALRAAIV